MTRSVLDRAAPRQRIAVADVSDQWEDDGGRDLRSLATDWDTPTGVRFSLCDELYAGSVDGAWWPRSRDPAGEVGALMAALPPRVGRITRVSLNPSGWSSWPRKITLGDQVLRLGWFDHLDADTITLGGASGQRLVLFVVPQVSQECGRALLLQAATGRVSFGRADVAG